MPKVPILILAFNRADHVKRALEPIQKYKPERIYLACDGPRKHIAGEVEAVKKTQKVMLDAIDWPCEVKTLFRDQNKGCAEGVNEAITWFFNHEEMGIVCEDDIVLADDFFSFCEALLPRYKDQDRIMQISARNTSRRPDKDNTYVYCQNFHCWGWATWRRAWQEMDMSMQAVNTISIPYLIKRLGVFRGLMMYKVFKNGYRNIKHFNSWATRWYLSILNKDGLVICPGPNLAINIGLDGGAHYDSEDKKRPGYDLKLGLLSWPLKYNDDMNIDSNQKRFDSKYYFQNRMFGLKKKLKRKVGLLRPQY